MTNLLCQGINLILQDTKMAAQLTSPSTTQETGKHDHGPHGSDCKCHLSEEIRYPYVDPSVGRFKILDWKGDFGKYKWVQYSTIGDGNCFVHAILMAYSLLYRNYDTKGRIELVKAMRKELSGTLDKEYNKLGNGEMAKLGSAVAEYSLPVMKARLDSTTWIGDEFVEHISNELDKDIYILHEAKQSVYLVGAEENLHRGRESIVIMYCTGHYELVGAMITSEGKEFIGTFWKADSEIIKFLKEVIISKKLGTKSRAEESTSKTASK